MKITQSSRAMKVGGGWFFPSLIPPRFLLLIQRNQLHQLANEFGHGSRGDGEPLKGVRPGSYIIRFVIQKGSAGNSRFGESRERGHSEASATVWLMPKLWAEAEELTEVGEAEENRDDGKVLGWMAGKQHLPTKRELLSSFNLCCEVKWDRRPRNLVF